MNAEDLQTFVEVASAGGVSAAARRLGVAKTIVSRRLLRLEADLGVQLLARTTRGVSLTEAGSTFHDYAAKIVADMEMARESVQPTGELRGRMRIAAPLTFGPWQFAPVLADLARQHPALHVHASYSDRFVNLLDEGFDCAIRVARPTSSTLLARCIGPIHASLVASPEYIAVRGAPESLADLADHEAILQGTEAWHLTDGDRTVSVNPQGRVKADNGVSIAVAAVAGLGIAMLPNGLIAEHLASGALVPVLTRHPPPVRGIFVVRPPGQHTARKVRVLTELLIECFGGASHVSGVPQR